MYALRVIRLARPWIGDEEKRAVKRVLESGMLVMGARVAELEERLQERCERRHAVVVSSGTAALELALEAIGIGGPEDTSGDTEVLLPALSWPSPAHAIARAGATPVLYDVDPSSWNGTPEGAKRAHSERVKAAIVIDQFGMPAADHDSGDVPLIVDAACSLGSTVDGRPAASRGLISCLSFHPRKVLTTGEGGACLTDDEGLADLLRVLRDHGRSGGGFLRPAGNHRMTEMAAAIGLVQMDRLDGILERRRTLAARYREALDGVSFQQPPREGVIGNGQTFGVLVDGRDAAVEALRARGVEAGRLSFAMNRIGSMKGRFRAGSETFDEAEAIEDRGMALPLHPLMSDSDQAEVIEAFSRHFSR